MNATKTRKTRTRKLTPEQVARAEARQALLVEVGRAIAEGRAYLDTWCGRKRVVGYNDANGWATCNNGSGYLSQEGFMVCLESIKMDPAM